MISLVFLFYLASVSFAAEVVWTRLSGSNMTDIAYGVCKDNLGSIYVAGYVGKSVDGQPYGGGSSDMILMKYLPDGTKEWTRLTGVGGTEYGYDVSADGLGHVYMVGSVTQSIDGQAYKGGDRNLAIIKYFDNGTKIWTRLEGAGGTVSGDKVITDNLGNVYIVGTSNKTIDGQPYAGGGGDILLMKYLANGTKVWTRLTGTSLQDYAGGVALDSQGYVYIVGTVEGDIDGLSNLGKRDIVFMKYSSDGLKLWTKLFGTKEYDYGGGITVDSNDFIYVAGETTDYSTSTDHLHIAKYLPDGTLAWARNSSSPIGASVYGVTVDNMGNIYMTGFTYINLDGEELNGVYDIYLMKYFDDGTKVWTRLYGNTSSDFGFAIVADGTGNVYITGYVSKELYGEPYAGGFSDIELLKIYDDMSLPPPSLSPTSAPTNTARPTSSPTASSKPTSSPTRRPTVFNDGSTTGANAKNNYDDVTLGLALPLSLCIVLGLGYMLYLYRRDALKTPVDSKSTLEMEPRVSPMFA